MYFKRFHKDILDDAVANEKITTADYLLISQFFYSNIMRISTEDVGPLSDIVELQVIDTKADISHVMVMRWPHLKIMCLKVARSNPRRWIYQDEFEEVTFFEYVVGMPKGQLIFYPSTTHLGN